MRIFSEDDLEAIYIIECLKNCGMQIKEIKQFTEWALAAGTVDVHEELKIEDVPTEMAEIRSRMKHVERFTNRNFWARK